MKAIPPSGKAQAAYRALPLNKARDYGKVKTDILAQLEISEETYWQWFWASKT